MGRIELPRAHRQCAALPLGYTRVFLVEKEGVEPSSPECKAGTLPLSYIPEKLCGYTSRLGRPARIRTQILGVGDRCSTVELQTQRLRKLVWRTGIEPVHSGLQPEALPD